MDEEQKLLDLELWLNAKLIRKQNFLKNQFISVFEEVSDSLHRAELEAISPKSRGFKISKGNDLLGFPYQVLDLVRDFDLSEGANIRLLNWFGNGFFITILLGKNRRKYADEFLDLGFQYGLSENQWDYPDLILNQNQSKDPAKIFSTELGFHHWVKVIQPDPDPKFFTHSLSDQVKKILGILKLPSKNEKELT